MDFKEKNKTYNDSKKLLQQAEDDLKQIRMDMGVLANRKAQAEQDRENAKTSGDKVAEKAATEELKKIEEEYIKTEKKLFERKLEIKGFEQQIDEIIKEVGQDPEIRKAIDNKLGEKYDKALDKHQKEKEELKNEKAKDIKAKGVLIVLTEMINENPENAKKLTELVNNKKKYIDLNEEAKKLDSNDPKDQQRLGQIFVELRGLQGPIETEKKEISSEIAKKIIPFTEAELDKVVDNIIENGLELDKSKNLDINKTLQTNMSRMDKNVKNVDRKIKRKEEIIKSYEFAKGKLEITTPTNTNPPLTNPPAPVNKPKWYQFGKWFAQWRESRRQVNNPQPTPTTPENETSVDKEVMKSELYKIARDNRTKELSGQREAFIKLNEVKAKKGEIEAEAIAKLAELTNEELELSKKAGIDR